MSFYTKELAYQKSLVRLNYWHEFGACDIMETEASASYLKNS